MADIEDLLDAIKKYKEKYTITETSSEAEKLRERIMARKKSDEECLKLQEEVRKFFVSDAPEKDKEYLRGYTESLSMICEWIELRRQQEKKV